MMHSVETRQQKYSFFRNNSLKVIYNKRNLLNCKKKKKEEEINKINGKIDR